MPPTASRHGAKSKPGFDDVGGLIERQQLPKNRCSLAEPVVLDSQRERILNAMACCAAADSYGATTVADVVEQAGVSRATFYALFADKEDCLNAVVELAVADLMACVVDANSTVKPWPRMVAEATAAVLELLAARRDFAHLVLIEAPAARGPAREMYAAGKRVLQAVLDRGRAEPVPEAAIPLSAAGGALAAAESLVVGQFMSDDSARLPELLPDITYIFTVPYLGKDEALRQSRQAERSIRGRTV
jgi:AcrR family transcriptional regulator